LQIAIDQSNQQVSR